MIVACGAEAAGAAPASRRRIIELRAAQAPKESDPPATSTLPEGSSVAVCDERAAPRLPVQAPASRRRIIELRAAQANNGILSPRHQHLAIGQQRRRMQRACGAEAARGELQLPVAGS